MKPQVLIGLEKTAAQLLRTATEGPSIELAQRALAGDAAHEFSVFDLLPHVEKHIDRFEEIAISAAIFGASRVRPAPETMFTKGHGLTRVRGAARQMARMAADGGTARIRQNGLDAILAKTGTERLVVLQKACTCHSLFKADKPKTIRVSADETSIADALNAATLGNARLVSDVAANLTTTRLAAYGFLSQAAADGHTRFQIDAVLDERTCPVCSYMNGKSFDVQKALEQTERALDAKDPADLESIAPWPEQSREGIADLMSSDEKELQEDGFSTPPFHPQCYAEGTRVYTRRGFVDFRDISITTDEFLSLNPETRQVEWVKATHYIVREVNGHLLAFKQGWKRDAFVVTDDHPMFYDRRVRGSNAQRFVLKTGTISDFLKGQENWLYKTTEHKGQNVEFFMLGHRTIPMPLFLKLVAYYLSEGSIYPRAWKICIEQSKHFDEMYQTAVDCGFRVTTWGKTKIVIHSRALAQWFKSFGKSHEKSVPDFVKELSPDLIDIFLRAYALGDGSLKKTGHKYGFSSEGMCFYTSSVRMRDDLVELLLRAGHGATFRLSSPKGTITDHHNGSYASNHDCWTIERLTTSRRRGVPRTVPYQGKVYDVSLERNHTLLIEWQGSVTWGSNCRCLLSPDGTVEETIPTMTEEKAKATVKPKGWLNRFRDLFSDKPETDQPRDEEDDQEE